MPSVSPFPALTSPPRPRGPVTWAALLLLSSIPAHSAEPVQASLIIPEAATHVIGDPIPLLWRFHNVSTQALAFMWEGCCRLNGRLTVTALDKPITMVPPGQALAHMFAKAERLEPATARNFDTLLSDWTQLSASGTYQLSGRYTGVLPEQQPQIPRGLALWRDAAVTPPIHVTLTSVQDYLAARSDHAARRGLELTLAGPSVLPPRDPIFFRRTIRNPGTNTQSFPWPEAASWWILDHENRRVRGAATALEGAYEEISLAPGSTFTRELPIRTDVLEGEPFGHYRVFVDLRPESPLLPRVPSNPLPLRWQLEPDHVIDLLRKAAAGPAAGLRNAPLKLLRLYLTPLRPTRRAPRPPPQPPPPPPPPPPHPRAAGPSTTNSISPPASRNSPPPPAASTSPSNSNPTAPGPSPTPNSASACPPQIAPPPKPCATSSTSDATSAGKSPSPSNPTPRPLSPTSVTSPSDSPPSNPTLPAPPTPPSSPTTSPTQSSSPPPSPPLISSSNSLPPATASSAPPPINRPTPANPTCLPNSPPPKSRPSPSNPSTTTPRSPNSLPPMAHAPPASSSSPRDRSPGPNSAPPSPHSAHAPSSLTWSCSNPSPTSHPSTTTERGGLSRVYAVGREAMAPQILSNGEV